MKHPWLRAFAILWLLDIITTMMFVHRFGVDMEGNPLMHWVIQNLGWIGFCAVKLAALGALAYITPYMRRPWPLQLLTAVMVPVIALNLMVCFGP